MRFNTKTPSNDKEAAARIILPEAGSRPAYVEAFKTLRTNLFFSSIDKPLKSIVITSALQSEGKTNTTSNMGFSIAQTGQKVLLIDSDLRKPFLTDIFNLKGNTGLTDLVVNALDEPVVKGDLKDISLGDLILLARFQSLTGELKLCCRDKTFILYLKAGRIMDVIWDNRPQASDYPSQLVREGILNEQALKTALDIQEKTGQRRRDVLVSMGGIDKDQLKKFLAIQASEAMRLVSAITEGHYSFLHRSWDSMSLSLVPGTDFNHLARELTQKADNLTYICRAMDRSIHKTSFENLWVMGAGKIPPNPSEIIGSERTQVILDLLKQKFDFILIDIAPVLPASDAMIMAPRTDGVLLVVRSGYGNKKLIKQVMDQFRQSNLKVLGAVLNRGQVKNHNYYYPYYEDS